MHPHCEVCGQPTDIEVGFYYGTGYVSYALSIAFLATTFVIWFFTIGFGLHDNRLFWWLGTGTVLLIVLQPVFMRLARSLWISFFVGYDENWQSKKAADAERVVKEHMTNW